MRKQISLPIVFQSNEYTSSPDQVLLTFEQDEINRVTKLIEVARQHDVTIEMDFHREMYYVDGEEKNGKVPLIECDDWRSDVEYLKIYANGSIIFYAQNKYNSADQIESDCFKVKDILESELQPS